MPNNRDSTVAITSRRCPETVDPVIPRSAAISPAVRPSGSTCPFSTATAATVASSISHVGEVDRDHVRPSVDRVPIDEEPADFRPAQRVEGLPQLTGPGQHEDGQQLHAVDPRLARRHRKVGERRREPTAGAGVAAAAVVRGGRRRVAAGELAVLALDRATLAGFSIGVRLATSSRP